MKKIYYWIIGIMIIFTPLGLLAEGTAWGEWGTDDLKETLGYVPQGIDKAEEGWRAIFPDYSLPLLGDMAHSEIMGYIFSAMLGAVVIYTAMLLLGKAVAGNNKQRQTINHGK
ncbi:MAG TPA: PDGLE domain-containing protein [Negativicutes bacterium]